MVSGSSPNARAIVGGKIAAPVELVAGQHEAPALDRDVAHRGDPRIPRVRRRRAVELDALRVHRRAHQRHVVLPADDRADLAERRVEHRHRRAVAEAPDQPLRRGRHDLAVLAEIAAVGREEQHRAVERAAVAFDDADHEIDAVGSRGLGPGRPPPGRARRRCSPNSVENPRALRRCANRPRRRSRGRAGRRKRRPRGRAPAAPRRGRLAGERVDFLQRPLAIEDDRRGLHDGDFEPLREGVGSRRLHPHSGWLKHTLVARSLKPATSRIRPCPAIVVRSAPPQPATTSRDPSRPHGPPSGGRDGRITIGIE